MPKQVDHRERRLLIADALMRVANERGLDEISLRHVAVAAGVSAGMVQHYFRTKDEMMRFAFEVVRGNVQERVVAGVAALGPDPSPRALLRAVLAEMLPLDEPRRADARVGLMFLAYSAVRPAVAALLHADIRATLTSVTDQIAAAQRAGTANPAVDPHSAAVALLAVAEGMNYYLVGGHYPAATALAALDAQLDLIFRPGPE